MESKNKPSIFTKFLVFWKVFFLFCYKLILSMKTGRGILALFLSYLIFHGWAVVFIVFGTITDNLVLVTIGTTVVLFWLGPFTPLIPLIFVTAFIIQRYLLFDKSRPFKIKQVWQMIKEEEKSMHKQKKSRLEKNREMYDFDQIVDRLNTNSVKYDYKEVYKIPEDVIPMWVADTDFKVESKIIEALTERIQHGIFGYSALDSDYNKIMAAWFLKRHNWRIENEWLISTPSVIFALSNAVRALTKENDAILICPPVYPPFHSVVRQNKRKLIISDLVNIDDRYEIDFADFEAKIKTFSVKMFILCSPHNPIGRVWTYEELKRIDEICARNQVFVVSDEIHADITFGHKHTVYAEISEYAKANCIICTAPSKTFNIAGLQISNIYIPNKRKRQLFKLESERTGIHGANLAGIIGNKAAYQHGEKWLDESIEYYKSNIMWVRKFLKEELPEVRMNKSEGTFLIWLDFRSLGLPHQELVHFLIHEAKLWLSDGLDFGAQGNGFMRMNIGCCMTTVKRAFAQLKTAIDKLKK